MTRSDSETAASVPVDALVTAARALVRAGRAGLALDLLDAATTAGEPARARLALAAAEAAIDLDYRSGTDHAAPRLAAAASAVEASPRPDLRWDLGFHTLRQAYLAALFDRSGPRFGPDGRDPQQIADLRNGARRLHDDSPDPGRRGWASLLQGWIADNIAGDREAAPRHYDAALACAETSGDDYLAFEALRHLGDHARDAGDHDLARRHWERSAEHAARAGAVPGTLAQQLLLAVSARDAGDESGARALAREIRRWAGAVGATRLLAQAEAFLDGVDPAAPPPAAPRGA